MLANSSWHVSEIKPGSIVRVTIASIQMCFEKKMSEIEQSKPITLTKLCEIVSCEYIPLNGIWLVADKEKTRPLQHIIHGDDEWCHMAADAGFTLANHRLVVGDKHFPSR